MDAPLALAEDLRAQGVNILRRWVEEGRQEDLYLEFKTTKSPMETADKQNLAAAVSGFANSDGGVLVWGVEAAKDKAEGVDCARALQPIAGLRRFLTNLKEYSTQLVAPSAVGVDHFMVEDPPGSDAGYAVTLVPKGDGAPHMAKAKDQHRYYYRAGESFLIMEPFMLADRFGRRPQPQLQISWRFQQIIHNTYVILSLKNIGRGIALYPALELEKDPDWETHPLNDAEGLGFGLPERPRAFDLSVPTRQMFAGGGNDAIHPGTSLDVVQLGRWVVPRGGRVVADDIVVKYSVFCEGYSFEGSTLVIPGEDLVSFVRR